MKVIIEHKDGMREEHEVDAKCYPGITAIGYQFYSKTIKNYILVHPESVRKIIFGEIDED